MIYFTKINIILYICTFMSNIAAQVAIATLTFYTVEFSFTF